MEILFIFRYQHITTQIEQCLTHKHDILKICNCKGGHIKMATIIKVVFSFATKLVKLLNLNY